MRYLQRLSDGLNHTETLAYLLHDKRKAETMAEAIDYNEDYKNLQMTGIEFKKADLQKFLVENGLLKDFLWIFCVDFRRFKFLPELIKESRMLNGIRFKSIIDWIVMKGRYKLLRWVEKYLAYFNIKNLNIDSTGEPYFTKLIPKWQDFISHNSIMEYAIGHINTMKILYRWGIPYNPMLIKTALGHPKSMKLINKWIIELNSHLLLFDYDKIVGNIQTMKLLHKWGMLSKSEILMLRKMSVKHQKCMKLLRIWECQLIKKDMDLLSESNASMSVYEIVRNL